MPRLPEPTRKQTLTETRQRLLDAAAAEFASQGYVGANINRISLAAGYAKGTIYNYFPSKRALMLTLIDGIAAAHTEFIGRHLEHLDDPRQRLEAFFRAGFAFVEQHPQQSQAMIQAVYGPDVEFKQRVYTAYSSLFTAISQSILEAGMAQGQFRPVDLDYVTALIMAIYLGGASLLDQGKVWLDPAHVTAFVLSGISTS